MKKRLTVTVDEELAECAKYISEKHGKTLSESVEGYFAAIGEPLVGDRKVIDGRVLVDL